MYSGYFILFDVHGTFSLSNGSAGKYLIIFGANMSLSVHVDMLIIKKKDILILGEGAKQGLDDTTFTAEAGYSINRHSE